jgi:hypothetical protein
MDLQTIISKISLDNRLLNALEESWCKKTGFDEDNWTKNNPSYGQCATTALVLQDYLGGNILKTIATHPDGKTEGHYYNIIKDVEHDTTRAQFPEDTTFSVGAPNPNDKESTRAYLLSNENTKTRYETLKASVDKIMGTNLEFETLWRTDSAKLRTGLGFYLVKDKKTWDQLGFGKISNEEMPDFDKDMVLASYMGPVRKGGYNITIGEVVEKESELEVTIYGTKPCCSSNQIQIVNWPKHVIKIEQNDKPVNFKYQMLGCKNEGSC